MRVEVNKISYFRSKRLPTKSPSCESFFDELVDDFKKSTKIRTEKIKAPPKLEVASKINSMEIMKNNASEIVGGVEKLEKSYRSVII